MTFCGIVTATKIGLHDNKAIKDLGEWIRNRPDALTDDNTRAADRTIHQVQTTGATVNLPTSQPVGQNRVRRNTRWYIQCQKCPTIVENTKRERAKHENTHRPSTIGD